jgi:hypothetical protein
MEVFTIRYSWQQNAALMGVCFLASTALAAIEHGLGFIAYVWSSPLFMGLMISFYGLFALALWATPAARLSQESISTHSYPFKIEWRETRRFKVSSFFGLIYLRIYGVKSRFPLWIPMPRKRIHSIYLFMQRTNGAETVLPAFADKRLNNALQGDSPHPAGSARL